MYMNTICKIIVFSQARYFWYLGSAMLYDVSKYLMAELPRVLLTPVDRYPATKNGIFGTPIEWKP